MASGITVKYLKLMGTVSKQKDLIMNRITLCLLFLFCTTTLVYSDADTTVEEPKSKYFTTTTKRYPNYIGFAGGFITGNGLAYRRWIKDRVGFQINTMPIYQEEVYPQDSEHDNDRDSGYYNQGRINLGSTLLINFTDINYFRIGGYIGCNHTISRNQADYYYTKRNWDANMNAYVSETNHVLIDTRENTLAGGMGAGVEFYVLRFGFSVMLGFYGSYCFEDRTKRVSPSIDGGVFFRL